MYCLYNWGNPFLYCGYVIYRCSWREPISEETSSYWSCTCKSDCTFSYPCNFSSIDGSMLRLFQCTQSRQCTGWDHVLSILAQHVCKDWREIKLWPAKAQYSFQCPLIQSKHATDSRAHVWRLIIGFSCSYNCLSLTHFIYSMFVCVLHGY